MPAVRKQTFRSLVTKHLRASRKARMLQYYYASRRVFDYDFQSISASGDAGRFGMRNCYLSVVCSADGVAVWAPPTAPQGVAGRLRRSAFSVYTEFLIYAGWAL